MTASPSDPPLENEGGTSLVDETARALTGYFGRLGRIGLDLGQVLLPLEGIRLDLTPLLRLFGREPGGAEGPRPSSPPSGDVVASRTLLVEAAGDRPGFGVFVVENLTAEPVSAPITVSAFVSEAGHEVRPRLLLRPAVVTLEPGQQAMVQLAAELDEALEPDVRYRGEISIPALSDRRIPIVLRRVAPDTEPVVDSPATDPSPETKTPTPRKSPRTRKAADDAESTAPKPRRRRATPKAKPAQ